MRRALIATVGTVAAVVAILQYKSSGTFKAAGGSNLLPTAGSSAATSSPPSTAAPTASASSAGSTAATSPATTTPPATAPPTTAPKAPSGPNGQFTGSDVTFAYGEIEVRLTYNNGKITSVNFPIDNAPDPRSEFINSQALPILTQELLRAQSLNIDGVSGATFTSNAFAQTVQAALSKAGK
ncbi:MAG: FMN-binding protein [Acidimicrobiaceae bacterium]|nr:FMN-binding protein [Acidimicrobiaceae bacterium]